MNTENNYILIGLLKLMGKLRSMTVNQAGRFFPEVTDLEIDSVLSKAVRDRLMVRKTYDLPIETSTIVRRGVTKTRPITAYYMTHRGREALREDTPKAFCVKTNRPDGVHLLRLYHDLLVVETLLWYKNKHDLKSFYVEDQLRGRDQTLADLRVFVVVKGIRQHIDAEIVVQNTVGDLKKKSSLLQWFTPSLTQADTIEMLKPGARIHIINLEDDENSAPEIVKIDREFTEVEAHLMRVLRQYGALTAPAVAKISGRDRGQANSLLNKLVAEGHLFTSTVNQIPGKKTGRPVNLYAYKDFEVILLSDRIYAARLSNFIIEELEKGNVVADIDRLDESFTINGSVDSRRYKLSQNGNAV